jgi:cell division septation protein DedD
MSDERDETRRFPAAGDRGPDDTLPDGEPLDDRTRITPTPDDATQIAPPVVDDATRVASAAAGADATRISPADDDWAPSRANPVWSGRAEVRSPLPGRTAFESDWPTGPPEPQPRDRWWMPIVVGIIVLILLALLGWGIYLIVQNSDGTGTPAPSPTTTAAATTTAATSAPTTPPSSEPTTTSPSATASTTEPTSTEVTIPALRGLALADARAALNSTGLSYYVLYRDSPRSEPNTVIDCDPPEGMVVPPDTRVTLVVAQAASTSPTASPRPTTPATTTNGG